MENKLNIQDIVGYLPHKLKVYQERTSGHGEYIMYGVSLFRKYDLWTAHYDDSAHGDYQRGYIKGIKPILRPLYDLTNEIEVNGSKVTVSLILEDLGMHECIKWLLVNDPTEIKHRAAEILYRYHFDIHGLIDRGLAIDINTLK